MTYDLGATARLIAQCRDAGGAAVTADAVTVTVTLPDGTTATPPASEATPVGTYHADYVTTVPGRHTVRWQFTGPAHAYTDVLDVRPEQTPAILSLRDAKEHLNLSLTDTREDDELRFWNNATTTAVEYFTGPVVVRTVTEDHAVGMVEALALRRAPVLEVTAVEPLRDGGTSYDPDGLNVNSPAGIATRKGGGLLHGPLRVTYRAGRPIVAENISGAARIILQHLWTTQRRSRSGGLPGARDDYSVTEPIPGLGYAIPHRAKQMLNPDDQGPGLA
ncbi:hypothetical protein JL475_24270 [Streptomyces sp. M2CJ-2]|uniref:hypothetical protein n=1 Tax=Streptomyces sp. M2CJ-2 TaxID=2803948 RepID=UPI0019253540|nr:hypothetical protein [Streptomyces sp. M2CJ-2]MBL3669051.1 hypothetical protein [Streptomyces sp. M2CJ-2]